MARNACELTRVLTALVPPDIDTGAGLHLHHNQPPPRPSGLPRPGAQPRRRGRLGPARKQAQGRDRVCSRFRHRCASVHHARIVKYPVPTSHLLQLIECDISSKLCVCSVLSLQPTPVVATLGEVVWLHIHCRRGQRLVGPGRSAAVADQEPQVGRRRRDRGAGAAAARRRAGGATGLAAYPARPHLPAALDGDHFAARRSRCAMPNLFVHW